MDKILRRFCSQEVQILIAKIEEDYTLFNGYDSGWRRLLEIERCRTRVENYCVNKVKRRAEKNYDRQQYLARILKQQLVPQTVEEFEDAAPMSMGQLQALKQQQAYNALAQRGAVQQSLYQHLQNQLQGTYK